MVQALPDQAIGAGGLDEMTLFDGQGRRGHLSREHFNSAERTADARQGRGGGLYRGDLGGDLRSFGLLKLLHRLSFEYKRPESLPARADEARQAAFIATHDQLQSGLAADEAVWTCRGLMRLQELV